MVRRHREDYSPHSPSMNELKETQDQSDFELLQKIIPSWMDHRIEPLIPVVEASVFPPTWQKIDMQLNGTTTTGGGAPPTASVSFIAGEQQGSAFVPMLITASGFATEIP